MKITAHIALKFSLTPPLPPTPPPKKKDNIVSSWTVEIDLKLNKLHLHTKGVYYIMVAFYLKLEKKKALTPTPVFVTYT